MFVKIPIEVEIPDSVTVAGIELTIGGYYEGTDNVIYGNSDVYMQDEILFDPTILVDFDEFMIKGWVDGEYEGNVIEANCPFDVNSLSSKIHNIARALDNSCKEMMKSTKKSKSAPKFSDMVNKQRAKNINKMEGWRTYLFDLFGQYIDTSSVENDFIILTNKIREGTPEDVIDQCKAIKGLMDTMLGVIAQKTGKW